jgi:hypothetical protein
MTPLIRQDDPAAQRPIREVAAGGTLIRRYALALTPTGAGNEAAVNRGLGTAAKRRSR